MIVTGDFSSEGHLEMLTIFVVKILVIFDKPKLEYQKILIILSIIAFYFDIY